MSIGSNIKNLREMHFLSQTGFGEILGVSDKAVSTWELDLKTPRMGTIQKISDHFNIPKSTIIDGTVSTVKRNVGERIKLLRTSRNMTQKDFAEKLNISVSSLSSYEAERLTPAFNTIVKMSEVLELPISKIIGAINSGEIISNITKEEEMFLNIFRALSDEGRSKIISNAQDLYEIDRYRK